MRRNSGVPRHRAVPARALEEKRTPSYCDLCFRTVKRGRNRCLEHSPYAQALIRKEDAFARRKKSRKMQG